ncbi:sodium/proline symporter PutP [Oceanirhabdus sp. W0125-5]|uniref:sodium/proline symporter PutP n=1 Tax=Oceanirhabdus sp. W0125-5 TaxID=2999116 RepID=UPI0022F2CFF5|nr:sodium/proline symporter PutP [Oceanirhabdus sp. W0125-5]WBW97794.1 sodium/proline symporter PutP [Oceanirhabdus sp. W0125-5]
MSEFGGVLVVFVLYFLFMLSIGIYFFKKSNNSEDYLLGGRNLGGWVISLSAQASDMSGWLLMGLPGAAYVGGMGTFWIAFGLFLGTFINWSFIAKRLRIYTEVSNNSITIPQYFHNRFKDSSNMLKISSSIIILIFFLIYTASGFVAGGKLFNSVFGISYTLSLTIGVIIIVLYTFLGGFFAVCWTDFFQGIIMFFAIIIVPIMAVSSHGGTTEIITGLSNLPKGFMDIFNSNTLGLIAILSSLSWGIGYFGQPHILMRFMAIKNASEIKSAKKIAVSWVFFSLIAAVLIGIIARITLAGTLDESAAETVFIVLVKGLFNPYMAGLFLAAILAAIMSTADSQLLVAASSVSEDICKTLLKRTIKDKELILISRAAVIVIAVIAYVIALNPNNSIMDLVSYAWAGFGASFGPTIIISLYWRKMTRLSAFLGIITGGVTTILWKALQGGIFDLYEMLPAFILSCVVIVITTLVKEETNTEIQKEFSEFQSKL